MPRSSGTYALPSGQPVVAGTTISDTVFNTLTADIANELTNSIPRDGTAPPTANLPMGNFKITGIGNGTASNDAAAFGQIVTTATGITNTPAGNIAAVTVQAAINELDTEKANLTALAASTGSTLVGHISTGTGAVATTVQSKLRESVSVKDFGAVGNGVTDDTTAVQNALNAGAHVEFPSGTYLVNQLSIPSTCHAVFSNSGAKLIPGVGVPSGATVAYWITATSLNRASISGLWLAATSATYPNLTVLGLLTCNNTIVDGLRVEEAGSIGIYGGNCVNVVVQNCIVKTSSLKGISFDGASQSGIIITNNYITGAGTAHGISFQLGNFLKATNNTCIGYLTFGIAAYQVSDCTIQGNDTYNTGREGINTEDSSLVSIVGNTCRWPSTGSISTDFGISVFGNAVGTQFVTVEDNTIINSGGSGIALAGAGTNGVSYSNITNNSITNANRTSIANHGGVLIYGVGTLRNNITGNIILDSAGTFHKFGVGEINFGSGNPSLNSIINNRIIGFTTSDVVTIASNSPVGLQDLDLQGFRTYTPTVSATVGSITTSSATGYYTRIGKIVWFYARATITTNGTGAGAVNIGLPFTAALGGGSGKELALTGKALAFDVAAASVVQVRNYDNTYPGANGAILDISGFMQIV